MENNNTCTSDDQKIYNINAIIHDVLAWDWLDECERQILLYKRSGIPTSTIAQRMKMSPSTILLKMRTAGIRYYKEVHNLDVDIVNAKSASTMICIPQDLLDTINSKFESWVVELSIIKYIVSLWYTTEAAYNIIDWRHMPSSFFDGIDPANRTALTISYLKLKTDKSQEELKALLKDYTMSEIIAGHELYHIDKRNIRATYNNGSCSII